MNWGTTNWGTTNWGTANWGTANWGTANRVQQTGEHRTAEQTVEQRTAEQRTAELRTAACSGLTMKIAVAEQQQQWTTMKIAIVKLPTSGSALRKKQRQQNSGPALAEYHIFESCGPARGGSTVSKQWTSRSGLRKKQRVPISAEYQGIHKNHNQGRRLYIGSKTEIIYCYISQEMSSSLDVCCQFEAGAQLSPYFIGRGCVIVSPFHMTPALNRQILSSPKYHCTSLF